MVAGAPGVQSVIKAMQEEGKNVGVFQMPAFGDGSWAESLSNTGNGFQVLSGRATKKVAGAFLAFLQQPENLAKLYEATGNFPSSIELGSDGGDEPDRPADAGVARRDDTSWWIANYTPVDLDVNGTFVVLQKMMAGEIDVDGAVAALPGRDREVGAPRTARRSRTSRRGSPAERAGDNAEPAAAATGAPGGGRARAAWRGRDALAVRRPRSCSWCSRSSRSRSCR